MVAKGSRDRRSSSSANNTTSTSTPSTKQRLLSSSHDKKQKAAKPIGICGFCLGDNEKNAQGVPEKMINCAECGNSGHPSCLKYSDKLVEKIRRIRWQCIDCKRCIVCNISDDSLLFCDYCDSGIHPKCCNPPLDTIPKGDFACHLCQNEVQMKSPKKTLFKTYSSSSTRSQRSNHSNDNDQTLTNNSRPLSQFTDNISNFFLTTKQKNHQNRKQSIQKAMKYLRDKKTLKPSNKKLVKRLQSTTTNSKANELLAENILSSSKSQRIKKHLLNDDLILNPQTSTPVLKRQSSNKKALPIEPITPPARVNRRSDNHTNDELNKSTLSRSTTKRKHSTNSLSPISNTSSVIIKKRAKNESPVKKTHSKNKRKDSHTDADQSDDEKYTKTTISKRKVNLDLSKYKNPPAFLHDSLPDNIIENDIYLFIESREASTKLIKECSEKFNHSCESIDDDSTNTRWPPYIVFGSDLIKTWYSSSYPQEYARVPRLYICEFCLKYMKCEQVYDRHRKKCTVFHPPANEIYHQDDLSVFEVDGNLNRIYCQNLCLLAKLFLDHKTLYYDVEPFLFYVLTKNDSNGCHFIGYFSKEKHCPQKYNLSCITVLPNCQRRGYGRFLIELSYLISQKEGQVGTPERPLSTLGAQTYEAYWKIKIIGQLLDYYNDNKTKCFLKTLMNDTGMAVDDIIETLQNLGVLSMKTNGKPVIIADVTQLEKMIKDERRKHAHWVSIDSEYLRFTPVLTPLLLTNEEKAIEKQMKEIQIVFKEIGREAAEAASLAAESADGTNPAETVRYIRRRKFGQKRRSIIVKRRTPTTPHNKSIKNESMITNEDSLTTDLITNDDDEHSQQYVSRRRVSTIDESMKEEQEENKTIVPSTSTSPKLCLKPPVFKQLKLDQFLKVVQSVENSSKQETLEPKEDIVHNDETSTQTRRINRNTRLHSTSKTETDSIKTENESSDKPDLNHLVSLPPLKTNGNDSITPSNDKSTIEIPHSSSIPDIDRTISLKRRSLTPSDIQALIENTVSPTKDKLDRPILNREISVTSTNPPQTPSSTLSEILANPLTATINGIEDENKIARIESQLKTSTIDLISTTEEEKSNDDQLSPPSSPKSMIVSQSDHYNYSTRTKQQQAMNDFNPSTNIPYTFPDPSYPFPYPPASYYCPSTAPMDYMPYYSTNPSTSLTAYPPVGLIYGDQPQQPSYYSSNDLTSISYNGNGTTPYIYPTVQSSSALDNK